MTHDIACGMDSAADAIVMLPKTFKYFQHHRQNGSA